MKIPHLHKWSIDRSKDLYGIRNWGADLFDINDKGEVILQTGKGKSRSVSLVDVISGIEARGFDMPVLLRVTDLLDARIRRLHESFRAAIAEHKYQGKFKGVYPIKVNQQRHVIEHITEFGRQYHHGLEAGSKAELIAAISYLNDPDAYLICNGYKDEEFADLGLYSRKLGINCVFVIEMPEELDLILDRAEKLGIEASLGVRIRLSSKATGQWADSSGDMSVFGLNIPEVMGVVDKLKSRGKLHWLKLLHYHIGSQIPNIRDIRIGVQEACRVYRGLVEEGAPMGTIDLGGGLAVDYDGSKTNFASSRNYTLDEYSADIVASIVGSLEGTEIPHPTIITESGRATVAYSSILIFNILHTGRLEPGEKDDAELGEDTPDVIKNMQEALNHLSERTLQECYNDALFYKDEIGQLFRHGRISLRQRAAGERIFWKLIYKAAAMVEKKRHIPEELVGLRNVLSDTYYGNFSLFQSLPDVWAIDQLFPIMPIHRLDEAPDRNAVLSDITCDCDGKIDQFVDGRETKSSLALHSLKEKEEYYLGVFLVGAYQETLGDLHNLLGDTNVVTIAFSDTEEDGYEFVSELEGDSVADVLSYVEYDPKYMSDRIRILAEQAVRQKNITPKERKEILDVYKAGMQGYTYFER